MRKGDRCRLEVVGLDEEAAGTARAGAHTVHVAGALPDEEVEVEIAHVSPHRSEAWATLTSLVRASPARVTPACRAYGQCGGCSFAHAAYPLQREWKRRRLQAALDASGIAVEAGATVPSPSPLGYRNKSKLVYARAGGHAVLGAYAPRSHEVVNLAGCRVAEPPLDEVAAALAERLDAEGVPAYDERLHEGLVRYAVLRVNHAGEVLCTLVVREPGRLAATARALVAARPEVVGVVENVNPTRGNALYGDADHLLAGRDHLVDAVGPVRLYLSPTAFFQVNRAVAARIYADLDAAAAPSPNERVVDAYAGVGGIALTLARRGCEVVGIESHAGAVGDATRSAALSSGVRARFVAGDVAAHLAGLGAADVVTLNPPRRGCAPSVLDSVAALRPRLVAYVSCAPETLARDLALLSARGYRARSVVPYDMLPETPHVEALALITPT